MSSSRVVIIGGGLAGIAAAIHAADDGSAVTLLEQLPRLGGATWSATRDGYVIDNGQHVFLRCCTEYLALLERIGSIGDVTLQSRMDVPVLRAGGRLAHLRRVALPAPLHLSPSLSRYHHLPVLDRVRVVRAALALRRLDLNDPALDQQTFGQWLRARGASQAAVDALWNLVCLPTVNLPADEASLMLAAKVFKTGLLDASDAGDIGWSNVPLQQLHGDAAARALDRAGVDVRVGARVEAVGSDATAAQVVVDGSTLEADAVIVAVPHDVIARLLPPDSFAQQARVGGLGRSPIVNVHLLIDRTVLHQPFIAGLGTEVQFVFDRTVSSGAPKGTQMLAISLSGAADYIAVPREQLVQRLVAAIGHLLPPARTANVLWSSVTREAAATFRGAPGTAALRAQTATRLPGVFLAGAWTDTGWPATMEGAVRSGNRAAAAAREYIANAVAGAGAHA